MAEQIETVNHPAHYQGGSVECIELLDAAPWTFEEAAAIKYIYRFKKKGREEDLKKAQWYLRRALSVEVRRRPVCWRVWNRMISDSGLDLFQQRALRCIFESMKLRRVRGLPTRARRRKWLHCGLTYLRAMTERLYWNETARVAETLARSLSGLGLAFGSMGPPEFLAPLPPLPKTWSQMLREWAEHQTISRWVFWLLWLGGMLFCAVAVYWGIAYHRGLG